MDAGDAVQGKPIGTLSEGSYLVDIMNQVGFDVAVPGNHEFDYGMDRLRFLANRSNAAYTSCNFDNLTTGKTEFAPYVMESYGPTKVAYVGITTPETLTASNPAHFKDADGNLVASQIILAPDPGDALHRQQVEQGDLLPLPPRLAGHALQPPDEHQQGAHRAHPLGDEGGPGHAGHPHVELDHKDQVQHDVGQAGDHQKEQGGAAVSLGVVDAVKGVVEKQEHRPAEVDL